MPIIALDAGPFDTTTMAQKRSGNVGSSGARPGGLMLALPAESTLIKRRASPKAAFSNQSGEHDHHYNKYEN